MRNFRVKETWVATFPEKDENFTKFLTLLKLRPKEVNAGFKAKIDNAKVEVLHPEKKRVDYVSNEDSMVVKITYGKYSFLFTGDIGIHSEKEIMERGFEISSFVLKSPHHGSSSSSSQEFIDKVKPKIVVVTQGTHPELPNRKAIERYLKSGIHILRTKRDGMIEFVSNGEDIEWKISKKVF